ncbi:SDR family NAD(P)-dependent oxidoreductase [Leucobacter sp. USCH14]|uniref:SDR family NAD(P)-dependent oxidoreductase n=1 Tax=Leucobacter sp. USCH14 TaxID=3024838 RepID=UPI00309FD38D
MTNAAPSVLVTGATGGIGRETAQRFVREGHRVAIADIRQDAVDALAEELRTEFPGADVLPLELDQSSVPSVEAAAEAVRGWSGQLTTLAVVAGVLQSEGVPVTRLPVEEFQRVHAVNLTGPFILAKHFIPLIPTDGTGSIVMVASYWGREAHPLYAAYCTSKAGVISLVQVLAGELAEDGIRVNSVAPGNTNTQMHQKHLRDEAAELGITFEEMRDKHWSTIPMRYAGEPHVISDAIFFLASDQASYITGATLDVNGGVVMS